MKEILIALDYDPTAEKIAAKGFELARALGAQVHLLHVISDPVYYATRAYDPIMGFTGYLDTSAIDPYGMDSVRKMSIEYLTQIRSHFNDDTARMHVEEGDYADSILKLADELGVDMIVVGSHSRRWLEKILVGSVTEKVLRQCEIPMLIVPTGRIAES